MTDYDIVKTKDIRFRKTKPRPEIARWEATIQQAASMPLDASLRLPDVADYRHVKAAISRWAKGSLTLRQDVDGRYILTRRKPKE